MHKKSQFWYMDFIIGLMIITIISVLFITIGKEISVKQYDSDKLINTGIAISSSFMSEGYLPERWLERTGRIGLLTNKRIDAYKLNQLNETTLTKEKYEISKYLLGIKEDYIMYIDYMDPWTNPGTTIISRSYVYGKPGEGSTEEAIIRIDPDFIEKQNMRINRYAYYIPNVKECATCGQLARMVIIVWKEE